MRSDDALLLDMLIAARKIVRFTAGMAQDTFEADEMAQSAVIRELQVIGEAARLVSEEAKTAYPAIDWRTMTGMRNRLAHGNCSAVGQKPGFSRAAMKLELADTPRAAMMAVSATKTRFLYPSLNSYGS